MSCGVGHRCSSDLALLWLLHRPEATALIQPVAWDPPYAVGVALKKRKKRHEIYLPCHKKFNISFVHVRKGRDLRLLKHTSVVTFCIIIRNSSVFFSSLVRTYTNPCVHQDFYHCYPSGV